MKPRHFTVLAGVTLVFVVLAAVLYASANRFSQGHVEGRMLAPVLADKLNAAAAIEIVQGDQTLRIDRTGEAWTIKDRAGYPASDEKARGLVVQLASAELVEPKTANAARYSLLELEDPAAKDAKSREVRILDDAGKPLTDIVMGKTRSDAFGANRGGFYVRVPGEAQTWLASGSPHAPLEIKDWVETSIFGTDTTKITRLTIEHAGEPPLVVEKSDGKEKFKLAQVPDGKKLKKSVTVDQIPQAFSSISLEDVRKLDATPTGDKVSTLTLESEGGLKVIFHLRKEDDASWLSFAAAGEGDAAKAAEKINAKGEGWEFKIPSWKADAMNKHASDLFETS